MGIPTIKQSEAIVSVTKSSAHKWGKTETESRTWTVSQDCVAVPGTEVTCSYVIHKVGELRLNNYLIDNSGLPRIIIIIISLFKVDK